MSSDDSEVLMSLVGHQIGEEKKDRQSHGKKDCHNAR
jgi:hypothetical protein